jgi:hypothetical protein
MTDPRYHLAIMANDEPMIPIVCLECGRVLAAVALATVIRRTITLECGHCQTPRSLAPQTNGQAIKMARIRSKR